MEELWKGNCQYERVELYFYFQITLLTCGLHQKGNLKQTFKRKFCTCVMSLESYQNEEREKIKFYVTISFTLKHSLLE